MSNIQQRNSTALSNDFIEKLRSGIAQSRASTIIVGGKAFLILQKQDGQWVYGQNREEVQQGSSWAINPLSFRHGWVCWAGDRAKKAGLLGEVWAPVHEPKPAKPAPIDDDEFQEARAFDAKCLDGEDAGLEVQHKINSAGGLERIDKLLGELQVQLGQDPLHPCPVVQLDSDWYTHSRYGKIYKPIYEVVDWATMDGQLASAVQLGSHQSAPEAHQSAPEPAPAPAKPAKASLRPAAEPPAAPAPTATLRTPGTPRRRPTAA